MPLPAPLRPLLPALLTVLVAALLLPVPARADEVADAVTTVAELRQQTRRTADELRDGTRRLEEARAELGRVRRQAAAAASEAHRAAAAEQESRRRLSAVVAAAYRSPVPDEVLLALTTGPDGLTDALAARADLDRVRGSENALLEQAEQQRARAQALAAEAERLAGEAREQAAEVEDRVRRLQRAASRAEQRLTEANARLTRARARAAMSCEGGSTAGHANGFLPRSALCPIGGGFLLRADAARAFLRMNSARRLCVNDAYRSYAGQVDVYRRLPSLAAVPGTSKHGLGIAVDLGCGAERFDSETYAWLKANAPRYGWVHPAWAEPGGSLPEPWHWEYVG